MFACSFSDVFVYIVLRDLADGFMFNEVAYNAFECLDVLPQRYGRTVPHAMRSSFFFGVSKQNAACLLMFDVL